MCDAGAVSTANNDPAVPPDSRPVCVLGLGLIGGSVLRALRRAGRPVHGYNRSAGAVAAARTDGYEVTDDLPAALTRAAAEDALIVLAVPMPAVDPVLAAIADHAPDCALTDVVSVKAPVRDAVRARGLADRFVGGHPMAGTAYSGWTAGDAALFDEAVWVVAADDGADPGVWARVARLAADCGAVVVPAESAAHDEAAARISHLPHVLAETLAAVGAADPLALTLAAGSFRDGTRVAGSAPELVRAMCEANGPALLGVLDQALELLTAARAQLAGPTGGGDGALAELVAAGHAGHTAYTATQRKPLTDLRLGEDGWLDRLRTAGAEGRVWRG